jgi:hypothetical protein
MEKADQPTVYQGLKAIEIHSMIDQLIPQREEV